MRNETFEETYTGLCPEYDCEMPVNITYSTVHMLGEEKTWYVKRGFDCEYIDNCKFYNSQGICPVHSDARDSFCE